MRFALCTLLLQLIAVLCFSQNLSTAQDSTNIYYHAVKEVVARDGIQTIQIEYNESLNAFFNKIHSVFHIKLLSRKNILELIKSGKPAAVYKISPINFDGKLFNIDIVPRTYRMIRFTPSSKKRQMVGTGAVWRVYYFYDCSDDQLHYKEMVILDPQD